MKRCDRSLEEVWEWKEQVYQDVKELTPAGYLAKISKDADVLLKDHGLNLRTVKRDMVRIAA
jgi:hypothetical protein